MRHRFALFPLALSLCFPAAAHAGMPDHYTLSLKGGAFTPATLVLPAHEKIKLIVKNDGATPAEFESADLDREQVVSAHDFITVYLGPLDPGVYSYFDDFDRTITGKIEVK